MPDRYNHNTFVACNITYHKKNFISSRLQRILQRPEMPDTFTFNGPFSMPQIIITLNIGPEFRTGAESFGQPDAHFGADTLTFVQDG